MTTLIKSGDELYEHFMHCSRTCMASRVKEIPYSGIMVSAKVRKDVLTNSRQGKITIGGTVKQIEFINKSGGVWLAKIEGQPND